MELTNLCELVSEHCFMLRSLGNSKLYDCVSSVHFKEVLAVLQQGRNVPWRVGAAPCESLATLTAGRRTDGQTPDQCFTLSAISNSVSTVVPNRF